MRPHGVFSSRRTCLWWMTPNHTFDGPSLPTPRVKWSATRSLVVPGQRCGHGRPEAYIYLLGAEAHCAVHLGGDSASLSTRSRQSAPSRSRIGLDVDMSSPDGAYPRTPWVSLMRPPRAPVTSMPEGAHEHSSAQGANAPESSFPSIKD